MNKNLLIFLAVCLGLSSGIAALFHFLGGQYSSIIGTLFASGYMLLPLVSVLITQLICRENLLSGCGINKAKETGLVPVELEDGVMTFSQARLTIVGRKLFKAPMQKADFIDKTVLSQWYGGSHGGLHDVYVIEIEKIYE